MPSHVLSAAQFSRSELDALFARTDWLLQQPRHALPKPLRDKAVAVIFYEASTRTRHSFERAAQLLGADVLSTEDAEISSSAHKGETVEDTVRVLEQLEVDAIVMRHKRAGMSRLAAEHAHVPIINGGDGGDEHPTQALLDLFTILRLTDGRERITITLCGDLGHSRTVRSLCRLLIVYANGDPNRFRLILCSPRAITQLGEDVRGELSVAGIAYEETALLPRAMRLCDVFYQTRVQRERFGSGEEGDQAHAIIQERFSISPWNLKHLRGDAFVLHPLPRNGEISPAVDGDARMRFFKQVHNGLYIRMALLEQLLASDV